MSTIQYNTSQYSTVKCSIEQYSTIHNIQYTMNAAGRFVTGLGRTARQSEIMERCKWMDVSGLTSYHSMLQMWKTVRLGVPAYMVERINKDKE